MAKRPYELAWTAEGVVARVRLRGSAALASPMLNRGTAFTLAERQALGLTGLLPEAVTTIMPLSNPTSHSEARPADLIAWTGGRALIATGSPFPPVKYGGVEYQIAQANNALIFPGLGLGVTVSRARRVSDGMLAAAADALAGLSGAAAPGAPLLPPVTSLRDVSAAVAVAVARAASRRSGAVQGRGYCRDRDAAVAAGSVISGASGSRASQP